MKTYEVKFYLSDTYNIEANTPEDTERIARAKIGMNNLIESVEVSLKYNEEETRHNMETRIAESTVHMTWLYTDLTKEGKVYPIDSEEVDTIVLMNFLGKLAIEFEHSIYDSDDWFNEIDNFTITRLLKSEFAIKESDKYAY